MRTKTPTVPAEASQKYRYLGEHKLAAVDTEPGLRASQKKGFPECLRWSTPGLGKSPRREPGWGEFEGIKPSGQIGSDDSEMSMGFEPKDLVRISTQSLLTMCGYPSRFI